jgi:hypothetical protein
MNVAFVTNLESNLRGSASRLAAYVEAVALNWPGRSLGYFPMKGTEIIS